MMKVLAQWVIFAVLAVTGAATTVFVSGVQPEPVQAVDAGVEAPQWTMPKWSTEQPEGIDDGLGLVDLVYAGEIQLGDLASSDVRLQYKKLLELVDWAKTRDADIFVIDDGQGSRFAREAAGDWSGKTTVSRWAFDPTWPEPGMLKVHLALVALQTATGKPWAVYGWGDAPQGASAVYVACHNKNRERWFTTALETAKARSIPIVAQVCPWREIGAPPHPSYDLQQRIELLGWMQTAEQRAADVNVKLYWSVWTAEAGTNSQNSQAPRLDADGIVNMTVQTWASMEAAASGGG